MTKKKKTKTAAPSIAALIIGIDGWEEYTLPLIESIHEHEPSCEIVVIDNASNEKYPSSENVTHMRTERLCYAAAINQAASIAQAKDWYIILSNDVLCTGPFMDTLAAMDKRFVVGPQIFRLARHERYPFVMGWCVCTAVSIFEELGGWDENYVVSSWEDVDYSTMVRESGYHLSQVELPFVHLDQRQRFNLPEFVGTHERNMHYFHHKHGVKQ